MGMHTHQISHFTRLSSYGAREGGGGVIAIVLLSALAGEPAITNGIWNTSFGAAISWHATNRQVFSAIAPFKFGIRGNWPPEPSYTNEITIHPLRLETTTNWVTVSRTSPVC